MHCPMLAVLMSQHSRHTVSGISAVSGMVISTHHMPEYQCPLGTESVFLSDGCTHLGRIPKLMDTVCSSQLLVRI